MTKNQHFVPQFYLRKFLNRNNEVEVLDLKLMKCAKPRGTQRICCAEFFYGIETGTPDETSQQIEEFFQNIEEFIGKHLDSIVDKILTNKQIHNDDKYVVANLMSMLWIRGREMRKQIHRMTDELTKWMIEQEYSIHPEKLFDLYDKSKGVTTSPEERKRVQKILVGKKYEIKPDNVMHLQNLENITGFANLFYHQYWTVYVSQVAAKFVTTDNPVATRFPKAKGLHGQTFLERAHYFPLTPDIFILATESHDAPDKPGIKFKRRTLFKGNERKILDLNATIVNQAHQYVYATIKQDLEDILSERKRQQELFATPEGKIIKAQLDAKR